MPKAVTREGNWPWRVAMARINLMAGPGDRTPMNWLDHPIASCGNYSIISCLMPAHNMPQASFQFEP